MNVSNVQLSDEGWYCCVVTNDYGSVEECAWLEVNSKQFSLLMYYTYYIVYSYCKHYLSPIIQYIQSNGRGIECIKM